MLAPSAPAQIGHDDDVEHQDDDARQSPSMADEVHDLEGDERGCRSDDPIDITRVEDGGWRDVYGVRAVACDVPAGCAALPRQRLAAPAAALAASVYNHGVSPMIS
ncbi:hypothetical protein WMF27_34105 [Sorangium sp. So ce281]|uniref:hypothetical protein n=1 Tax=unclassified Sorangium TaxID=2621164 RepID=UPI003F5F68CF